MAAGILLALATVAVYAPVTTFEFVDYDDRAYVSENPYVQRGFTCATVRWALTAEVASIWCPLTMLSHALDWTVFGAWAGGHHAVNVALHAGNVLLLFALLVRTTGAPGRSALVAAFFALHPLRVESVAWIAERKDVLSAAWFLGALNAYVGWVRCPTRTRYGLVVLLFAAGLLSKPMVVTLPLVALLLDRWPLARHVGVRRLVLEKVPLMALSLGTMAVTLVAAREAQGALRHVPLAARLENAIVSLAWYLEKAIWPVDLGVLYLHPAAPGGDPITALQLGVALVLVAGISVWVLRESRFPYLFTGWGWYLIALLPVIGLVQAGVQARADRYGYLPLIGPSIMVVWRVGDWVDARAMTHAARRAVAAACLVILALLAVGSRRQLAVWRNSESLYHHALAVEPRNFLIHYNLGTVLAAQRRDGEALAAFERARAVHPAYAPVERMMGTVLERQGRLPDAIGHYHAAVRLDPRDAASLRLLGDVLLARGEPAAAVTEYRAALVIDADDAHTHNNLGNALAAVGDAPAARAAYERALALDPTLAGAHGNLAALLDAAGESAAALAHRQAHVRDEPASAEAQYALAVALLRAADAGGALPALREALRLDPERPDIRQLLAWALATRPAPTAEEATEALRLAEAGVGAGVSPDPTGLVTLAAAQAAAGRFPDALATVARARARITADATSEFLPVLDDMERRFRRGEPYRDASRPQH
jgi:tetratricopeptide (TPR) repeat protein